MTKHNIEYKVFLEGRNASSNMIYVFIGPRINSQAGNYLSMVYTTQCSLLYALAMNKRLISFLRKSRTQLE